MQTATVAAALDVGREDTQHTELSNLPGGVEAAQRSPTPSLHRQANC